MSAATPARPEPAPDASALIVLSGLRKSYNLGRPNQAEVLHGLDLRLQRGEFVALIGPSGSGKSTLLNILGLLERPSAGSYRLLDEETQTLDEQALTLRRRRSLGFVFQFHHLLPAFSALENVTLPALMRDGRVDAAARAAATGMLGAVGLADALHKRPAELSGGMQQRVAIARALVNRPPLVLADEPTGNLDRASSDGIFQLMRHMHREQGTAFLVVTHDPRLADRCDRVVELVDGRIESDTPRPAAAAGGAQTA
ncbi:MAG: ABC transporter ATP-binding protein [Rubrivivax sp.]|nr:ABC transporter ATP-binding protein [Rubrivivax sp.]